MGGSIVCGGWVGRTWLGWEVKGGEGGGFGVWAGCVVFMRGGIDGLYRSMDVCMYEYVHV